MKGRGEEGYAGAWALQGLRSLKIDLAQTGRGIAFRSLWGADVTLIEAAESPLPDMLDPDVGACVARHMRESGVRFLAQSPVKGIEADDDGVTVAAGDQEVRADAAVVAVGVE